MDFHFILKNYYKDKDVSPYTVSTHESRLRNIEKFLPADWLVNPEETIEKIEQNYNKKSTVKTSIASILVLCKAVEVYEEIYKIYLEKLKSLQDTYIKEKKEELKTPKDLPLTWNSIKKLKKDLFEKFKTTPSRGNAQRCLLYLLYTCHPPVRNDYSTMRRTQVNNCNTYDDKFFYFRTYKTVKNYGVVAVPIHKTVKTFIKRHGGLTGNGDLLFCCENGQEYTKSYISKLIKEIFNVGISMLRKIYISTKYQKLIKMNREVAKDNQYMMHSRQIMEQNYLQAL